MRKEIRKYDDLVKLVLENPKKYAKIVSKANRKDFLRICNTWNTPGNTITEEDINLFDTYLKEALANTKEHKGSLILAIILAVVLTASVIGSTAVGHFTASNLNKQQTEGTKNIIDNYGYYLKSEEVDLLNNYAFSIFNITDRLEYLNNLENDCIERKVKAEVKAEIKTETITETITETVTVNNTEFKDGFDAGKQKGEQIAKKLNASPASSTQDPLERDYLQYGGEASDDYVDGYNEGLWSGFNQTIKEKQNNQNAVNYSVEDILDKLRTHTKFENPEIYEIKVNAASNSLIIITKEGSKYKKTTVTANDSSLIQTLNNTALNVKQDDSSIDDQNYLNAFYNVLLGASEITTNSYVVVESENVEFDLLKQYAASKTDNNDIKSKIEQLSSSGEAVKIHISILDKKAVVYATSGTHELSVEFETPANVSKNYIIDSLEDIFIGSAAEKNEAEAKFIVNVDKITVEENTQLKAIYIFNDNTAESTVS